MNGKLKVRMYLEGKSGRVEGYRCREVSQNHTPVALTGDGEESPFVKLGQATALLSNSVGSAFAGRIGEPKDREVEPSLIMTFR